MLEQEIKNLLEANYELSRENNKILRKMHNSQKIDRIFRILYALVALGLTIAAFYYLEPYIRKLLDLVPALSNFKDFLPR